MRRGKILKDKTQHGVMFYLQLLGYTYNQRSKEIRRPGRVQPSNNCSCASVRRETGSLSQTRYVSCRRSLGCRRERNMSGKSQSTSLEGPGVSEWAGPPGPRAAWVTHRISVHGGTWTHWTSSAPRQSTCRHLSTPQATRKGSDLYSHLLFKKF